MTSDLCGNCLATHGRRAPKELTFCVHKEARVGINDKACEDYVDEGLYGNADKISLFTIKELFEKKKEDRENRSRYKESRAFRWALLSIGSLAIIAIIVASSVK